MKKSAPKKRGGYGDQDGQSGCSLTDGLFPCLFRERFCQKSMIISRCRFVWFCLVAVVLGSVDNAGAEVVPLELPMTIERDQLRSLIVAQAYPLAGERARIVEYAQGCNQITLARPVLSFEGDQMRFLTKVDISWGTPFFDRCMAPIFWQGYVEVLQRPAVDSNWQLSFIVSDSRLLDSRRRPVQAFEVVWNLVKQYVHTYLQEVTIHLIPPVSRIQDTLLPMFDRQHQQAARQFLHSMHPGQPRVSPRGLRMPIHGQIEVPSAGAYAPEPKVSEQDYRRLLDLWQVWDAYLIHQIKVLAEVPLSDEDRHVLLDTMLRARYAFVDALERQKLTDCFIREQFFRGWKQLAPLFRRHLKHREPGDVLGYLAFFTAYDALQALDQLGPSIGIEISADGFRRLAALVSSQRLEPAVEENVDPVLRKSLGLDPWEESWLPTDPPGPAPTVEGVSPTSLLLPNFFWETLLGPKTAWSGTGKKLTTETKQTMADIQGWTAEYTTTARLLAKVMPVLRKASREKGKKLKLPGGQPWFEQMLLATAWQESCFRQYYIRKNKITYLLSYNGTSVGLMQVNEQVWRGIYNIQKLRWNVTYNAQVGAEILALYLRNYLLREKVPVDITTRWGRRFLAGWLYSLYNGGPAQRKAYLKRHTAGTHYQSDTLFFTKYDKVVSGQWQDKVSCLP